MNAIMMPYTKKLQTLSGNVLSRLILDGIVISKTTLKAHPRTNTYGETPT